MAAPMYNVFVGAETGLLKGVTLSKSQSVNLNSIKTADKQKEICVMCWGDDSESEVCVGLKNRQVLVYDVTNRDFRSEVHNFEGGVGYFRGIAKVGKKYLTAVESGLVKLWADDDEECVEIDAGKDLCKMVQNPQAPNIFATGGKENDLKIWNLENPCEATFKAKNVKNDWLNLRVPVWIMGMQFLPGSDKIVTCTGHHQVRVYDPATPQRRPVLDVTFDEYPLTSMSLRHDVENQVIIGNTQGKMALLDLRNGKLLHVYKGFAGSIRDIKCHPSLPLVASCGLDRHLRIHNINSKEMVHKVYLKSRLNCLLYSSKDEKIHNEDVEKETSSSVGNESGIESAEDDDEIWENLEVVKTRTVKKNLKPIEETDKKSIIKRKNKTKTNEEVTRKKKQKNK